MLVGGVMPPSATMLVRGGDVQSPPKHQTQSGKQQEHGSIAAFPFWVVDLTAPAATTGGVVRPPSATMLIRGGGDVQSPPTHRTQSGK